MLDSDQSTLSIIAAFHRACFLHRVHFPLDFPHPRCSIPHQRQALQGGQPRVRGIVAQAAEVVGKTGFEEDALRLGVVAVLSGFISRFTSVLGSRGSRQCEAIV